MHLVTRASWLCIMEVLDSIVFHCNRGRFKCLHWGLLCHFDTLYVPRTLFVMSETIQVTSVTWSSDFYCIFLYFFLFNTNKKTIKSSILTKSEIYQCFLFLTCYNDTWTKAHMQQKMNIRHLSATCCLRKNTLLNIPWPPVCMFVTATQMFSSHY